MSDIAINLDEKITELEGRREELRDLKINPPGPSPDDKTDQRERINYWIAELDEKINTLKQIKINKSAANVIVRGASDVEKEQFDNAMANLNNQIQRDQVFTNTLQLVQAFLDSADALNGMAGRA